MADITVDEIKQNPQGFLERLEMGEALTIVRSDKPVADVTPVDGKTNEPRPVGLCKGEFRVPDDFDAPLPGDVLELFESA